MYALNNLLSVSKRFMSTWVGIALSEIVLTLTDKDVSIFSNSPVYLINSTEEVASKSITPST